MFCLSAILLAATAIATPQELEEAEIALSEKTAVVEQDDSTEDGELIFDDEEPVAELEDAN